MGTLDWGGPPRNDIKLAPKAVLSRGNRMDRDETKHSSVEGVLVSPKHHLGVVRGKAGDMRGSENLGGHGKELGLSSLWEATGGSSASESK